MKSIRQNNSWLFLSYGGGAFGQSLTLMPVPLLFLYYLTEYAQINPTVAGIVLAIPKVFDVVVDPWIGRNSDKFARSRGSRATVIMASAFLLPLALSVLFLPYALLSPATLVALYAALLITHSFLMTASMVAHTSLTRDLTDDVGMHVSLLSARAFGGLLGGLAVSVGAPILITAFGGGGIGFQGMAAVLGLIAGAFLWMCYLSARGTPLSERAGQNPSESFVQSIKATFKNRCFYALAIMLAIYGGGVNCLFALLPYINKYVLKAPPESLSMLLGFFFAPTLLGAMVSPWLNRNVGAIRSMAASLILGLIGMFLFFAGLRQGQYSLIAIGGSCFALGGGVMTVLIYSLATQQAAAFSTMSSSLGLYFGILFSAEKFGHSAASFLAGVGLSFAGVQSGAATVSMDAVNLLGIIACLIPLVAVLISLVILVFVSNSLRSIVRPVVVSV
jgi:Na+/melibiose symporter-like transporter